MSLTTLLLEALSLLMIGMTFVTAFLGILVFIIPLLDKISPDDSIPEPPKRQAAVATGVTPQTVAAITVAVNQYRQKH